MAEKVLAMLFAILFRSETELWCGRVVEVGFTIRYDVLLCCSFVIDSIRGEIDRTIISQTKL